MTGGVRSLLAALRRLAARLRADRSASATVEFVVVFVPFVGMIAYAAQIGLSQFFLTAASDAAERAARLAATQPIAHCAALRNAAGERVYTLDTLAFAVEPARRDARSCLNQPSPCAPMPGAWTCTVDRDGTVSPNCDVHGMRELLQRASAPGVRLSGLEITYSDSRFGHVGEPVVPLITVTIRQRDLPLGDIFIDAPQAQPAAETSVVGSGAGDLKWEASQC